MSGGESQRPSLVAVETDKDEECGVPTVQQKKTFGSSFHVWNTVWHLLKTTCVKAGRMILTGIHQRQVFSDTSSIVLGHTCIRGLSAMTGQFSHFQRDIHMGRYLGVPSNQLEMLSWFLVVTSPCGLSWVHSQLSRAMTVIIVFLLRQSSVGPVIVESSPPLQLVSCCPSFTALQDAIIEDAGCATPAVLQSDLITTNGTALPWPKQNLW